MHNYLALNEKTIKNKKETQSMATIYGIKRGGKI